MAGNGDSIERFEGIEGGEKWVVMEKKRKKERRNKREDGAMKRAVNNNKVRVV